MSRRRESTRPRRGVIKPPTTSSATGRAGPRRTAKTVRSGGMRIPTDKEILVLHEKHAPTPGALDLVYTHCVIVCGIAEQLCSRLGPGLGVDIDLARAGSLLHDIGVYRLYGAGSLDHANYIRHGVLGYDLL